MGFLNAVKNLFTEEVEVEEKEEKTEKKAKKEKLEKQPKEKEVKEEIQKEVFQVEIPSPIETKEEKVEKPQPKKEEYKFPFFDDNDFDTIEVTEKPKEETIKEVYKPQKEEKKVFKPSPIISPVYGFLDKNYQKDEIIKKTNEYNPRKATVDEIRDRAYGSLESDIETTLFGNNRVLFDEENKEDVLAKEIEIPKHEESFDSETIGEKPRHEKLKDDDDLTDLLEAEMEKDTKEREKSKKPRKISDKELFNLIDSMYEREMK